MNRSAGLLIVLFFITIGAFAQPKLGISGSVDWETSRIEAEISLDLASAGLRLPAGRTQAEAALSAAYLDLIRQHLLGLQADSSSTLGDLAAAGDFSLPQIDAIANTAVVVPPAMRPDMREISSRYTIELSNVSAALLRHSRPAPAIRTLLPVSAANYTGIIIIAAEELPVHGMRSSALPIPCLFPKIWDTNMNLIYDRNMLDTRNTTMARYSPVQNIFQNNPSGLSDELRQIVGDKPLRIFARGVFGIKPTDLIIDRNDALLIISSEENRKLLAQGKVVFILDDSVLRYKF